MAAAEIQVVNPENLQKIESFFNDSAYREAIENSASFNTRLCVERRLRMPFLDPQTGVAQNHCSLFMSRRQRMPGAREGQIYTYPAARWRKARRQYLSLHSRGRWGAFGSAIGDGISGDGFGGDGDGSMDAHDTDSKDSHHARDGMMMKDDVPKEWLYDDIGMEELDPYDEPEPDSDEDYYDDSYSSRHRRGRGAGGRGGERGGSSMQGGSTPGAKGKRRGGGSGANLSTSDGVNKDGEPGVTPKGRGRGGGRGRKKAVQQMLPYEVAGDADKPYGCELCGARYKTRPGLTYHYTHSHKDPNSGGGASASAGSDGDSRDSPAKPPKDLAGAAASTPSSLAVPNPAAAAAASPPTDATTAAAGLASEYQDSYVTFLNNPAGPSVTASAAAAAARRSRPVSSTAVIPPNTTIPPTLSPTLATVPGTTSTENLINPSATPDDNPKDGNPPSPPPTSPQPPTASEDTANDEAGPSVEPLSEVPERPPEAKHAPSPYCDFCLGDQKQNKKTGVPEELVSCSDCGRSGERVDEKDIKIADSFSNNNNDNGKAKGKEIESDLTLSDGDNNSKEISKRISVTKGRKKCQTSSNIKPKKNTSRPVSSVEILKHSFNGAILLQDGSKHASDRVSIDKNDGSLSDSRESSQNPGEIPSTSYSADDFDNFVSCSKILECKRNKPDSSQPVDTNVQSPPSEVSDSAAAVRKSSRKNSTSSAVQMKRTRRK